MDWTTIITSIVSGITVVGFIYGFLRNFKSDINSHLDRIENRVNVLEERMFWLATGKKLEDAILEERIKRNMKTDP